MLFTRQLFSEPKDQVKPSIVTNPTSKPWWKSSQVAIVAVVTSSIFTMTAILALQAGDSVSAITAGLSTVILPAIAITSAILVPLLSNPIHSLISLLVLFVATALMYLVQGAEYLAFVFLIVYVGAVAILFLFVIMLINVKNLISRAIDETVFYRIGASIVGLVVFYSVERTLYDIACDFPEGNVALFRTIVATDVINFEKLYTNHWPLLAILTMILLLSMLGSIIVGTVTDSPDSKKDR